MILATTDTLQGQNIKQYLGIVTAGVVYGMNPTVTQNYFLSKGFRH
jgi:uncharacterized protein YbjQ (UPF0145 family)